MSDSQLVTEYDQKTSTSSLSNEPWNKVQSIYAAKSREILAERTRQLRELEEKVAETANWNQKRREWTNTSRGPIVQQKQRKQSEDVLDDLEELLAAGTRRILNYKNRPDVRVKPMLDIHHPLDIGTTRSTVLSNPSPKIESPRISASTTARVQTKKKPMLYSKPFKDTKPEPPRQIKLSITHNPSTLVTPTKKASKDLPSSLSLPIRRQRRKTLPGTLAAPPLLPTPLPPMKVEPLHIPITKPHTRLLAKTPTRIPVPGTSTKSTRSIDNSKPIEKIKPIPVRRLKSNSTLTPKLQASKSNKSTDENLLRKSTIESSTPPADTTGKIINHHTA
ncbi:hypothetical protein BY458DRAFT_294657 [Sporodiniella umbellata]|nr:hypothetical protein BY458DRAFT_294657 [Sporodiniella umbellata]